MAKPILQDSAEAGELSPKELHDILKQAGFEGKDLEHAYKIVYAETKRQPFITNETAEGKKAGNISYGIFQITPVLLKHYYNDFVGEEVNLHDKTIEDWDDSELKRFLDPSNIANFALYVTQREEAAGNDPWAKWTPHQMIENLKGDSDTPSPYFKDLGIEGAKEYGEDLKTWHGDRYKTLPGEWEHARKEFASIEGTEYGLGTEAMRYDNVLSGRQHEDGSFSFAEPLVSAMPATGPTIVPPNASFGREAPASATPQEMAEPQPQSAFTNPDQFIPQFVRDGVSQETDPRQSSEFQPNFMQ